LSPGAWGEHQNTNLRHCAPLYPRLRTVSQGSGYYAWATRPPSRRAVEDQLITERIRVFRAASRSSYGAPRKLDLREDGHKVSRKRVARLMREAQIRGAYRRRRFDSSA
jgi:hypothetical protein